MPKTGSGGVPWRNLVDGYASAGATGLNRSKQSESASFFPIPIPSDPDSDPSYQNVDNFSLKAVQCFLNLMERIPQPLSLTD